MMACWDENQSDRPSFRECERRVESIMDNESPEMYRFTQLMLADAWRNLSPTNKSPGTEHEGSASTSRSSENIPGPEPTPIPDQDEPEPLPLRMENMDENNQKEDPLPYCHSGQVSIEMNDFTHISNDGLVGRRNQEEGK